MHAVSLARILLVAACLFVWPAQVQPASGRPHRTAFQLLQSVRQRIAPMLGRRSKAALALVDPSFTGDASRWETFEKWSNARGICFEHWQVGDVGNGLRGAVASRNVKEGSVLVSAPPDAVLSVREADACPLSRSFVDHAYCELPLSFFVCFLVPVCNLKSNF